MRAPLDTVPEVVQEIADNPTAFGRGMLTVIRGGLEYGAEEVAGEEAIGGLAALLIAASGIGDVVVVVVVVIVLAIAILGEIIHHFFTRLTFSVGPMTFRVGALADVAFGWSDNLTTWCAHTLQNAASGVFHGFIAATQWAIQQATHGGGTVTNALIGEAVQPVKTEVDHLWLWVNDINKWVGNIASHVGVAASVAIAEPGNVLGQLASTEQSLRNLWDYAGQIDGKLTGLSTEVGHLSTMVQTLLAQTGAVRAVNVGWQDMATELTNVQAEVQRLINVTYPQIQDLEGKVITLLPLGVLLAAGAEGIDNLRKLEDDPCQCPQLGGIGGVWATIMAAKHELKGD